MYYMVIGVGCGGRVLFRPSRCGLLGIYLMDESVCRRVRSVLSGVQDTLFDS